MGLTTVARSHGMEKSFWNSWTGFLAQMIFFSFLGFLGALVAENLLGY